MLKSLIKRDEGFTLIEVIIVLAIGALIILVVLQAIGSAQVAQRDNTRKEEAARMVSLLEQYASNNGGVYPTTAALAQAAIANFDANLGSKYPAANWAAGCTQATSGQYYIGYSTAAPYRNYTLLACLEKGGPLANGGVQIHP